MNKQRQWIGIATPQANPTVEVECHALFNAPLFPLITRLISTSDSPRERLIDYVEQLPQALESFDTLNLSALLFACTGSSYLLERDAEQALIKQLREKSRTRVITATLAIHRELQLRGVKRLALLAPYPAFLKTAATRYWTQLGYDVMTHESIDIGSDTRAIYDLTADQVLTAVDGVLNKGADVLLLSGTGMPTLDVIRQYPDSVISSNLCLVAEAMRQTGQWGSERPIAIHHLLN